MARKQWKVSQPETQIKCADAAEWEYMNPVLSKGEPGYVTDTGTLKIGDGETSFDALPSITSGAAPLAGEPIIVVPHGDDANYARPDGVRVVYWLGSVEPLNSVEDDLWSGVVDVA